MAAAHGRFSSIPYHRPSSRAVPDRHCLTGFQFHRTLFTTSMTRPFSDPVFLSASATTHCCCLLASFVRGYDARAQAVGPEGQWYQDLVLILVSFSR